MAAEGAVGVDLETRFAVQDMLVGEAELLDDRRFEEWLELFTPDIEYTAPVRVTRKSPAPDVDDAIGHFDDTIQSLTLRVKRLRTDVAWAEDPPSHTRRFVTNVRIRPAADGSGELDVRSNLMLFRSRGDLGAYDLIVGERHDRLRLVDGAWRIAARRAVLDQSSLSTKNLGVFLGMRVTVDLTRCQGYGNCVSAAPAVFDLDDAGLVVLLEAQPSPEQADAVRNAVKMCPVAAIEVDEEG